LLRCDAGCFLVSHSVDLSRSPVKKREVAPACAPTALVLKD
jgi:hypothetical protein